MLFEHPILIARLVGVPVVIGDGFLPIGKNRQDGETGKENKQFNSHIFLAKMTKVSQK